MSTQIVVDKYSKIFSEVVAPTSWAGAPQFISEVLGTILPQIMSDVGNLNSISGEQKRSLVVEITTIGLNIAFDELTTSQAFSKDDWNVQVKSYLDPLIEKMIETLIKVDNGKIQFSGRSKILLWCCPWLVV